MLSSEPMSVCSGAARHAPQVSERKVMPPPPAPTRRKRDKLHDSDQVQHAWKRLDSRARSEPVLQLAKDTHGRLVHIFDTLSSGAGYIRRDELHRGLAAEPALRDSLDALGDTHIVTREEFVASVRRMALSQAAGQLLQPIMERCARGICDRLEQATRSTEMDRATGGAGGHVEVAFTPPTPDVYGASTSTSCSSVSAEPRVERAAGSVRLALLPVESSAASAAASCASASAVSPASASTS